MHPSNRGYNATEEEKQRKRQGKQVWEKRSKYTSNTNNGHKLQGWSESGKLRFNKLMADVEDSRSNPIGNEVEVGMMEKWRTMDGGKNTTGISSQSATSIGKENRMPGYGGRTALRLSAGAMERYGFLSSTVEMEQLNFGDMVKEEPEFQNQAQV